MNETDWRGILQRALDHGLAHLENLESNPVGATADYFELRQRLNRPLADAGETAEKIIDDLVQDVAGGLHGTGSGRFYGWVIGGSLPAALAADILTSTWDQNSGLFAVAPGAAVVEEVGGAWLMELLHLPPTASFALVTGCQMAHVTCLAAARNALLQARDWDVEKRGLFGAPRIRILSSQRHGSIERALRLLGFGSDSVTDLPLDERGQLAAATLERALSKEADTPTILLLPAGEINTGIFDNYRQLIPLAHRHGAWVHVDGAFGLWAAASPRYRHLVDGVEQADSWATDGHKWLNMPFDSGYAFVAHPEAHRNSMSHRASYLTHSSEVRDQMDWNPEWSRRARGFATYAGIRQLGRSGVAELVDRCCRHAHRLVMGIAELAGAELVYEPLINQGLVRFPDPRAATPPGDHDRRNDQVIARIVASGEAFFTGTTWQGMRCMRVSVCNWQTSDSDVERTIEAVRKVLDEIG